MKTVNVLNGQTMLDIALQELGDVERAGEIAVLNDRSITDDLVAGESLSVPVYDSGKRTLVQLFSARGSRPASGGGNPFGRPSGSGVDFWEIENDFIVQ
jgi:hypothetical protein